MARVLEILAVWKGRILAAFFIAAAGAIAGGLLAWWLQANHYRMEIARLNERIERERGEAKQAALDQTALYRKLEGAAVEAIQAVVAHAAKERELEESKAAAERAEYLAGTRRMSLAVSACQADGAGGAASNPAAAGASSEARAELAPATAAALDAIASDGDAGIRDANECIDLYNGVRRALSGK